MLIFFGDLLIVAQNVWRRFVIYDSFAACAFSTTIKRIKTPRGNEFAKSALDAVDASFEQASN